MEISFNLVFGGNTVVFGGNTFKQSFTTIKQIYHQPSFLADNVKGVSTLCSSIVHQWADMRKQITAHTFSH